MKILYNSEYILPVTIHFIKEDGMRDTASIDGTSSEILESINNEFLNSNIHYTHAIVELENQILYFIENDVEDREK